jgi:hypothetical protein
MGRRRGRLWTTPAHGRDARRSGTDGRCGGFLESAEKLVIVGLNPLLREGIPNQGIVIDPPSSDEIAKMIQIPNGLFSSITVNEAQQREKRTIGARQRWASRLRDPRTSGQSRREPLVRDSRFAIRREFPTLRRVWFFVYTRKAVSDVENA